MSITFTLPWSVVVPDNAKTMVSRGRAILSPRYRDAKRDAAILISAATKHRGWNFPCRFEADVWFPDNRKRDAGNLRKLITDAIQLAAVLEDDCWIHDERWIRAGVDKVNPRVEVMMWRKI